MGILLNRFEGWRHAFKSRRASPSRSIDTSAADANTALASNLFYVRLDKFLKVSRLSKRRSEAHEALEHGRITKEGRTLKPGYQVKPGDVLEIHYATRFVTVAVLAVPLRVTPAVKPADLYEIVATRRDDPVA